MVHAFSSFLDFCYLVRQDVITESTLQQIDDALSRFHRDRIIFYESGVRPTGFNLPRQHSLMHYRQSIQLFGAPNGLCSSITESKHIKAMKKPWRRTNHNQPLGQMLTINQRLDKLAAARVDFTARKMLKGPLARPAIAMEALGDGDDGVDPVAAKDADESLDQEAADGPRILNHVLLAKNPGAYSPHFNLSSLIFSLARNYPRSVRDLSRYIGRPDLQILIQYFLYDQLNVNAAGRNVNIAACPHFGGKVRVFHSAVAIFYAPSDTSGLGGMHREWIRACPSWNNGPARNDCIFLEADPNAAGFRGLHVAQVLLFFSFVHAEVMYPCALVQWFELIQDWPCDDTGLWMVKPELHPQTHERMASVVHLDAVVRGAHLMPIYGTEFIP